MSPQHTPEEGLIMAQKKDFYTMTVEEVLHALETGKDGLPREKLYKLKKETRFQQTLELSNPLI
jgi:hypothetical protein